MSVSLQHSFYVLLLMLLFLSTDTQAHGNISLGSSITAGQRDNSYWKSPSGDFAFGFRKVKNDGYLVAIWFKNAPENPIVWSGNRNTPVQAGSTLELTSFGWLVLNDSSGTKLWITEYDDGEVHHAALFDTGNMVIVSRDSVILWQSFHQPTDTMLPGQTLDIGQELIGRYSEQNYTNGRFKFTLQPDGNLLLYTTKYPFKDSRSAYWGTMTSEGYRVIYNHSGYMNLIETNGSLLRSIFTNAVSAEEFYQRATIDHDGVFRLYVYPKKTTSHSESLKNWRTLSFIPSNICLALIETIGSGTCGLNSYCSSDDGKPICQCPPGYVLLDPNDKNKGCKQNFVSQSCNDAMNDSDNFEFKEMPRTDWAYSDYEDFEFVSEDWCKQACLTDCHCGLILYGDDEHCFKKKLPMSNGRNVSIIRGKTLIKVRKENNSTLPASDSEKKGPTVVVIGLLVFVCLVFLNIAFLLLVATMAFFFCRNRQRQKMFRPLQLIPGINLRSFTYNELEAATGRFKEELGSGNFGTVYKAILENGECVAVKKSDKTASLAEQEFQAEICAIDRTNHKNLIKLLGFCNEGKHRLLVYEYMSNGCLANHLFGASRVKFFTRSQIALDVARGILYLHQECNSHIIHCDIKPHNILLDKSLTAKVSDFGQAKLLKIDQTRSTTVIRGTRGYVAPEWFLNMPITAKVDVYSFGILLLQLICCRQFLAMNENDTKQATLADWAYQCYKEGKLQVLVEGDDEALADMLKVQRYVMVAMWCTQENPSIRPTMKRVIHMLEGVVQVPVPPHPYSFFSSI